eukprot:TRINITY_DN6655_c0_g1_i2.p1 TRINITY_DN6655_c0_g1~~TRINITY_DN6655_c0_g1_i2.p1  ORF type:complete len:444 (+),score=84.16 TRINITY_DN6655_c0_g1_i2:58-1332(+)
MAAAVVTPRTLEVARGEEESLFETDGRGGLQDLGFSKWLHWRRVLPATGLFLGLLALTYITVLKQAPQQLAKGAEPQDSSLTDTTELMTNIWKEAHHNWNCPVKYSTMEAYKSDLSVGPMLFLIEEFITNEADPANTGPRRRLFLEIRNQSEYFPWQTYCHHTHGLGCILMQAGKSVDLTYTFRKVTEVGVQRMLVPGAPVKVKEAIISFFDIDGHGRSLQDPDMEYLVAHGPHRHHWLGSHEGFVYHKHTVDNGQEHHTYWGERYGLSVDVPSEPTHVTSANENAAVSFLYENVPAFSITLGSTHAEAGWTRFEYARGFYFSILYVLEEDAPAEQTVVTAAPTAPVAPTAPTLALPKMPSAPPAMPPAPPVMPPAPPVMPPERMATADDNKWQQNVEHIEYQLAQLSKQVKSTGTRIHALEQE